MLDLQTVVCFDLFKNLAKTLVGLINLIPTIFTDDFNIKRSIDSFFIKKVNFYNLKIFVYLKLNKEKYKLQFIQN